MGPSAALRPTQSYRHPCQIFAFCWKMSILTLTIETKYPCQSIGFQSILVRTFPGETDVCQQELGLICFRGELKCHFASRLLNKSSLVCPNKKGSLARFLNSLSNREENLACQGLQFSTLCAASASLFSSWWQSLQNSEVL